MWGYLVCRLSPRNKRKRTKPIKVERKKKDPDIIN